MRDAKGPHAREVTKMRKCDEDKAKKTEPKIGRPRGHQEALELKATLVQLMKGGYVLGGSSTNVTQINRSSTARSSKWSVVNGVVIANTPSWY